MVAEHRSAVEQLLRHTRDPMRLAAAIEGLYTPTLDDPVIPWRRSDRPRFVRRGYPYRIVDIDRRWEKADMSNCPSAALCEPAATASNGEAMWFAVT